MRFLQMIRAQNKRILLVGGILTCSVISVTCLLRYRLFRDREQRKHVVSKSDRDDKINSNSYLDDLIISLESSYKVINKILSHEGSDGKKKMGRTDVDMLANQSNVKKKLKGSSESKIKENESKNSVNSEPNSGRFKCKYYRSRSKKYLSYKMSKDNMLCFVTPVKSSSTVYNPCLSQSTPNHRVSHFAHHKRLRSPKKQNNLTNRNLDEKATDVIIREVDNSDRNFNKSLSELVSRDNNSVGILLSSASPGSFHHLGNSYIESSRPKSISTNKLIFNMNETLKNDEMNRSKVAEPFEVRKQPKELRHLVFQQQEEFKNSSPEMSEVSLGHFSLFMVDESSETVTDGKSCGQIDKTANENQKHSLGSPVSNDINPLICEKTIRKDCISTSSCCADLVGKLEKSISDLFNWVNFRKKNLHRVDSAEDSECKSENKFNLSMANAKTSNLLLCIYSWISAKQEFEASKPRSNIFNDYNSKYTEKPLFYNDDIVFFIKKKLQPFELFIKRSVYREYNAQVKQSKKDKFIAKFISNVVKEHFLTILLIEIELFDQVLNHYGPNSQKDAEELISRYDSGKSIVFPFKINSENTLSSSLLIFYNLYLYPYIPVSCDEEYDKLANIVLSEMRYSGSTNYLFVDHDEVVVFTMKKSEHSELSVKFSEGFHQDNIIEILKGFKTPRYVSLASDNVYLVTVPRNTTILDSKGNKLYLNKSKSQLSLNLSDSDLDCSIELTPEELKMFIKAFGNATYPKASNLKYVSVEPLLQPLVEQDETFDQPHKEDSSQENTESVKSTDYNVQINSTSDVETDQEKLLSESNGQDDCCEVLERSLHEDQGQSIVDKPLEDNKCSYKKSELDALTTEPRIVGVVYKVGVNIDSLANDQYKSLSHIGRSLNKIEEQQRLIEAERSVLLHAKKLAEVYTRDRCEELKDDLIGTNIDRSTKIPSELSSNEFSKRRNTISNFFLRGESSDSSQSSSKNFVKTSITKDISMLLRASIVKHNLTKLKDFIVQNTSKDEKRSIKKEDIKETNINEIKEKLFNNSR